MVTGFFEVSPSTRFPVTALRTSTANNMRTVTTRADPIAHPALRSPASSGCSLTGSGYSADTRLLAVARPNAAMVRTNTVNRIQNSTQYSHSMFRAWGAAGCRTAWRPGSSGAACTSQYADTIPLDAL